MKASEINLPEMDAPQNWPGHKSGYIHMKCHSCLLPYLAPKRAPLCWECSSDAAKSSWLEFIKGNS